MNSFHPAPQRSFPKPVLLSLLAGAFVIILAFVLHVGSQPSQARISDASRISNPSRIGSDGKPVVPERLAALPADQNQRPEAAQSADARGSILVKTEPPGARVSVSDAPWNPEKTPALLSGVKTGQQSLDISLEGYESVTVPVEVKENATTGTGVIQLNRCVGKLRILSTPLHLVFELKSKPDPDRTDATIDIHESTPYRISNLPVGEYEVTLLRENWEPITKTVAVTRAGDPEAYFDYPVGNVHIVTVPPGAQVNQVEAEATHPRMELGVSPLWKEAPPGPVKYSISLKGYAVAEVNVDVQPGAELPLNVTLEKTAVKTVAHHRPKSHKDDDDRRAEDHERTSTKVFRWLTFFQGN
jgi:hypothetical protein